MIELQDKIDTLEGEIEDKDEEITTLEDTIKELREEIEDQNTEIKENESNISDLKDKIEEMQDKIDTPINREDVVDFLYADIDTYKLTWKPVVIAELWHKKLYLTYWD